MKPTDSQFSKAVSFVLPCLNEANTLAKVIREAQSAASEFSEFEIVIVDNGSEDRSVEIAQSLGARVVECKTKGYGAAIAYGIQKARFPIVVIADSDATYDLTDAPKLVSEIYEGRAELVLGNRLMGPLEKGAMPILHRHFGTPVLSFLISRLYGKGQIIRDCNSGMRAFKKMDFDRWHGMNVEENSAKGMEFASDTIIRALSCGARVIEKPIRYRKSCPQRKSHLRTWRDGWRHLSVIFSSQFRDLTGVHLSE